MNIKDGFYNSKIAAMFLNAFGNTGRNFLVRQWILGTLLFFASILIFHSPYVFLLIPSIFLYPFSSYGWNYLKYLLFIKSESNYTPKKKPSLHLNSDMTVAYMIGKLLGVVLKFFIKFAVAMFIFILAVPFSIIWTIILNFTNKN